MLIWVLNFCFSCRRCVTRPGGMMLLGMHSGRKEDDVVLWNAHRIYGPVNPQKEYIHVRQSGFFLENHTGSRTCWHKLLDAPVLSLDVTV